MIKIKWNITFSVRCCHWYRHFCHVLLTSSSMAPFFHYVKTTERRCDITPLVMWCCWHQCGHNMALMALSMASFVSRERWWKKGATWLLGNVMPVWYHLTLMASSIAPLHLLVQDDQNDMHQSFHTVGTSISIMWCQWQHCIHYVKTTETVCTISFLSCDAIDVVSVTCCKQCHQWHHSIC